MLLPCWVSVNKSSSETVTASQSKTGLTAATLTFTFRRPSFTVIQGKSSGQESRFFNTNSGPLVQSEGRTASLLNADRVARSAGFNLPGTNLHYSGEVLSWHSPIRLPKNGLYWDGTPLNQLRTQLLSVNNVLLWIGRVIYEPVWPRSREPSKAAFSSNFGMLRQVFGASFVAALMRLEVIRPSLYSIRK